MVVYCAKGSEGMLIKNDVVQFNEKHKWCGCIGFVYEVKGNKITVGMNIPEQGIAYVYCKLSELEYIGRSALVLKEQE